jgi:hypothetical protein
MSHLSEPIRMMLIFSSILHPERLRNRGEQEEALPFQPFFLLSLPGHRAHSLVTVTVLLG